MKLIICGGGISGLSAAYYAGVLLSRIPSKSFKIILIEKSSNVGGWMKTNVNDGDRQVYGGPINEHGPRSIRTAGVVGNNTLQLISDLSFEDLVLPVKSSDIAAKKRLLYVNNHLCELPNSIFSMLKTQEPFSKPLAHSLVPGLLKKVPPDYETMHEVCSVRFGKEVADYLVSAFVRGVFAADSRHLSMKAAFPAMWDVLKPKKATMPRRPSIPNPKTLNKAFLANPFIKRAKRERWTQWASSKGFSYFTEALAKQLVENMGIEIIRNAEIEQILLRENNKLQIKLASEEPVLPGENIIDNVDHVISALPSYSLSKILRRADTTLVKKNHHLNVLGFMLNHIRWVDVAVTNLEYNGSPRNVLPTVGFGHLVPSVQPSEVLGIVYDSCAFPQHDRIGKATTRLTCMAGGSWFSELFGDPDTVHQSRIENSTLNTIAEQLCIKEDPLHLSTNICKKCIPMYGTGHTKLIEEMEDLIEENNLPISLVGASYWGVSINDCIFNSKIAVHKFLRKDNLLL